MTHSSRAVKGSGVGMWGKGCGEGLGGRVWGRGVGERALRTVCGAGCQWGGERWWSV